MSAKPYDLLVVGGGIHGAGIAQAGAAAGLSVLLLERKELAHGTSSRSSKLIHGGLRYLESGQFGLVRECLLEREWLLRMAPELVHRIDFLIPVYAHNQRAPWKIRAGLALYALLAGGGKENRFSALPRRDWDRLDGLSARNLRAVFRYSDAQTDDAALTRAVARSAAALGAELRIPAELVALRLDEHLQEVDVREGTRLSTVRARVVVNAAGPWVRLVLSKVLPVQPSLPMELVQGSHLLLEAALSKGIYYLEARDQRAVFAMPWQGRLLLGTTEMPFRGDPERVHATGGEEAYLLETLYRAFPHLAHPGAAPVVDRFAGVRVLPAGEEGFFHRSRETILVSDRSEHPRLLTLYGGKLTSYRATTDKVMQRLAGVLPQRQRVADPRQILLTPE